MNKLEQDIKALGASIASRAANLGIKKGSKKWADMQLSMVIGAAIGARLEGGMALANALEMRAVFFAAYGRDACEIKKEGSMKKAGIQKVAILGGRGIVEGVIWDADNGRYQSVSGTIDIEKILEALAYRLLRSKRGVATDNCGAIKMKVYKVKGGDK